MDKRYDLETSTSYIQDLKLSNKVIFYPLHVSRYDLNGFTNIFKHRRFKHKGTRHQEFQVEVNEAEITAKGRSSVRRGVEGPVWRCEALRQVKSDR